MHFQFTTWLLSLLVIGCASSGPTGIEREIRDREREMLRQQKEETDARAARMREQRQQGVKNKNNWVVEPIVNPVTETKTCVMQPALYWAKSYNGNSVDLTIDFDKTTLRISTLPLLNSNGAGISVDGKPIHLFQRKTASGNLVIDKTQRRLLVELNSGKSAEVTFAIAGTDGMHKLQFELDGFSETYLKLNSC